MKYDFDQVIDRRGTHAVKTDGMQALWGRTDLIPMWVADMDFATPPFIMDAILTRSQHPILGYTIKPDSYYRAISEWTKTRYNLHVKKEEICYVPGIVAGLGLAIRALTAPDAHVLIMPPVYPPFAWLVERNGRKLLTCPLQLQDGRYRMDLDRLPKLIKQADLVILCNPHNPGGTVWTAHELRTLADLCQENDVLVLSDEIHADLTLPPFRHTPFVCISEEAKARTLTFMSPSKAFNIPGLSASHALIFNENLRARFLDYIQSCELDSGHVFACPAVEAAYTHGTDWLQQCLEYISGNIDLVEQFMAEHLPEIRVIRPMASYLIWLDCRALNLTQEQLRQLFAQRAGLALNDGESFGQQQGHGFMRMNVGCPRSIIRQALTQLETACKTCL